MISINNVGKPHTLANRTANLFRKKKLNSPDYQKDQPIEPGVLQKRKISKEWLDHHDADIWILESTWQRYTLVWHGPWTFHWIVQGRSLLVDPSWDKSEKKEKRMKNQSFIKKESLILQFNLKSLVGIKFQYVDVDFIVVELKKRLDSY